MDQFILDGLKQGYTAYQVADYCVNAFKKAGFTPLTEQEEWHIEEGGKYVVCRGGSAVAAFVVGDIKNYRYKIVASHVDSPALKLKYTPVSRVGNSLKLNVETYGAGIWSTFLDVPLALAGRIVVQEGSVIKSRLFVDEHTFVIPNVAIHMNREINKGYAYNEQFDLSPLLGEVGNESYLTKLCNKGETIMGYDLFLVNKTEPFFAGVNEEYLCSGRLDDQVSVYASVKALCESVGDGICMALMLDNEEVGSSTNEGADSDFFAKVVNRINRALGKTQEQLDSALAKSFLVSADNAHAIHPNHPELSDPTNKVLMGGGVVIKHHANRNYLTMSLTGAVFRSVMSQAGVKVQDFFMRSDLRCGSTMGCICLAHLSIPGIDVGLPQLAMHSSLETMAVADVDEYVKAMKAVYASDVCVNADHIQM